MNRFLTALNHCNYGDELTWYKNRPDGSVWKCFWRRGKTYISFIAIEIIQTEENGFHIRKDGKVKKAFTIQLR